MKIAIVVQAIPPHCGGGEQVAWIHAVEAAKRHDVSVLTLGESKQEFVRDGVRVFMMPRQKHNFFAYLTSHRGMLNRTIDHIDPHVIHCHMPQDLSVCIRKKKRLFVTTIHDGVPENELLKHRFTSRREWMRFKLIRRVNMRKSDLITCVSHHNCAVMREIYSRYADRFSVIQNPIYDRYLTPVDDRNEGYVLNFGRQIALKMSPLLDVSRDMPGTRFIFVGTGDMVREYDMQNVEFVGFSTDVDDYIDRAALCVFPSQSENLPLVGLEAMARGKPVIATKRGFSEYIEHMQNGYLLDSIDPSEIANAIGMLLENEELRESMGRAARATAEQYKASRIISQYDELYARRLQPADDAGISS